MSSAHRSHTFLQLESYVPPAWTHPLKPPTNRYHLASLPTPIHRLHLPDLPPGTEVWIKRDDLTGSQISGNKARKLEFLMAECKEKAHDSVITIGGIQSNHCRATSVAASYLGLESHLILRTPRHEVDKDPGLTGNLLVARMLGSNIHKVTKEEYVREGSVKLCELLAARLRLQGKKPYVVPVGGSNALGTWGYLEAIKEVQEQSMSAFSTDAYFTDLAMACGSGGTTAGIALGARLSGMNPRVHAYAVCDDEDYFYTHADSLLAGLYDPSTSIARDTIPSSRSLMRVVMAKGSGYAISTREELEFVKHIAEITGVIMDPVYSGKALFKMMSEIRGSPGEWEGRKILFFHTGGLFGLWDKEDQLMEIVNEQPRLDRFMI